jgi:hypothetical protein
MSGLVCDVWTRFVDVWVDSRCERPIDGNEPSRAYVVTGLQGERFSEATAARYAHYSRAPGGSAFLGVCDSRFASA